MTAPNLAVDISALAAYPDIDVNDEAARAMLKLVQALAEAAGEDEWGLPDPTDSYAAGSDGLAS